jgi:hypothetical protein
MSDSQYAVFHFDVKTMSMAGDATLIFDTLPEAESHCRAHVASNQALGCRILDHDGKIVQTFADAEIYGQHHGRPAAKRNVLIGAACLVTGAGAVGLDAWLEWRLILRGLDRRAFPVGGNGADGGRNLGPDGRTRRTLRL